MRQFPFLINPDDPERFCNIIGIQWSIQTTIIDAGPGTPPAGTDVRLDHQPEFFGICSESDLPQFVALEEYQVGRYKPKGRIEALLVGFALIVDKIRCALGIGTDGAYRYAAKLDSINGRFQTCPGRT